MNKKYIKLPQALSLILILLSNFSAQAVEQSEAFRKRLAVFQQSAEQPKENPARPSGTPSGAAAFKEKLAVAQLEKALQDLNIDEVTRIVAANKHLVNLQKIEPLRKVVMVVSDRLANQQLGLFNYLLSLDNINVNLTSDQGENALDAAIKNIKTLRSEKSKERYRTMARQLIEQGAQLSALAGNDDAQAIVAQLQPQKKGEAILESKSKVSPERISQVQPLRESGTLETEGLGAGRMSRISEGSGAGVQRISEEVGQLAGRVESSDEFVHAGRHGRESLLGEASGQVHYSPQEIASSQQQVPLSSEMSLDHAPKAEAPAQHEVVQGSIERPSDEGPKRGEGSEENDLELASLQKDTRRALLSNKIATQTELFTRLDDQIRDLEAKQRNEEEELRNLGEKIQKTETDITNLHQKRQNLTSKLGGA